MVEGNILIVCVCVCVSVSAVLVLCWCFQLLCESSIKSEDDNNATFSTSAGSTLASSSTFIYAAAHFISRWSL